MSLPRYEEIKYIRMLGLERLKPHPGGFYARCPICGDSQKSKTKTRLSIMTDRQDVIVISCFNCGFSPMSLKKFISVVNPGLYQDYLQEEKKYRIESAKEGNFFRKPQVIRNTFVPRSDGEFRFKLNEKYFIKASSSEEAVRYCHKRRIEDRIDSLYYNVNTKSPLGGMLIFPFYDGDELYGFQGRSIKDKRFHTHSPNESLKAWNIFGVDDSKDVLVFEAIIDAMMFENSIAMAGSELSLRVREMFKRKVFCFDNDQTGFKKALKYAENGERILIYPDAFKWKDPNEAVQAGVAKRDLYELVNRNIYEGISAIGRLKIKMLTKKGA